MEKILFHNKECFIVDEHHQVLTIWKEFKDRKNVDLSVLTFDHHTDTLPSFSRIYAQNPSFSLPSNLKIDEILQFLQHDEHIDYAVKNDIVKKSVILAHTVSDRIADERIMLLSDGFVRDDIPLNSPILKDYFDLALEDEFLSKFQKFFPTEPYILDIDLDYFKTYKSLKPEKYDIFRKLVENAEIITISREEIWVKLLTFENSSFNSETIIEKLQELF